MRVEVVKHGGWCGVECMGQGIAIGIEWERVYGFSIWVTFISVKFGSYFILRVDLLNRKIV